MNAIKRTLTPPKKRDSWRLPILLGATCLLSARAEDPPTRILAVSEEPPPPDLEFFPYFSEPVINNLGHAAFLGFLVEGAEFGDSAKEGVLLRGNGESALTEIARIGGDAPIGEGSIHGLGSPQAIDDSNRIIFYAEISKTAEDSNTQILLGEGASSLRLVAEDKQQLPSGDILDRITGNLDLDNHGRAAFRARVNVAGEILASIFLSDPESGLLLIAQEGQKPPFGEGEFSSVVPNPSINKNGQVLFSPRIDIIGGSDNAIFRLEKSGSITLITRNGESFNQDEGMVYHSSFSPAFNDAGNAVLLGRVFGATDGFGDGDGYFIGNGTSSLRAIVRENQPSPDGNGNFAEFGRLSLNQAGQITFAASLDGTAGGEDDDLGIFRGDETELVAIVREGQLTPDGMATFSLANMRVGNGRQASINSSGQVLFQADIATAQPEATDTGIFLYDDTLGLRQVARIGDTLLGSTISELGIKRNNHVESSRADALNDFGQVAYRFVLADGREGVAIWGSLPEAEPTEGPNDIRINVDQSNLVTIDWTAPSDLSQTIESSTVLEQGATWEESTTAPKYLGNSKWQWQHRNPADQRRFFRIFWEHSD